MSETYQVRLSVVGDPVRRWTWIAWIRCEFPYAVWYGEPYPNCSLVELAYSIPRAKRIIKRDQKRRLERRASSDLVYQEGAKGEPILPDLRASEYASLPFRDHVSGPFLTRF